MIANVRGVGYRLTEVASLSAGHDDRGGAASSDAGSVVGLRGQRRAA